MSARWRAWWKPSKFFEHPDQSYKERGGFFVA